MKSNTESEVLYLLYVLIVTAAIFCFMLEFASAKEMSPSVKRKMKEVRVRMHKTLKPKGASIPVGVSDDRRRRK